MAQPSRNSTVREGVSELIMEFGEAILAPSLTVGFLLRLTAGFLESLAAGEKQI